MSHLAQACTRHDAEKRRRQYLLAKAEAGAMTFVGCLVAVACVGVLSAVIFELAVTVAFMRGAASSLVVPGILSLASIGTGAVIAGEFWRSSVRRSRAIPYVPPVAAQIAALPADEVLVRASGQPPALPAEMLRPVRGESETTADELLRTVTKAAP